MTFFLILCLLLVLASVLLARPFLSRFSGSEAAATQNVAMIREQMRELEKDVSQGVVSAEEAEETKREIERRALNIAKKTRVENMNESRDNVRIVAIAVTMGWVTIGSVVLYLWVGRPDLARVDGAGQLASVPRQVRSPSSIPRLTQSAEQAPLADVNTMIDRLAARLEAEPDDVNGWRMLGWSHMKTANFDAAAQALERAVELAPQDDDLLSLYGEAVTRANRGTVTPFAQTLFQQSQQLNPANARAGYFTGVAHAQAGEKNEALEIWLDLLMRTPDDADWKPDMIAGIRAVAAELGIDVSSRPGLPQNAPQPLGDPSPEDVQAASEMSQADRQAMILSMVEGLAERLELVPDDPEGWERLIRSYVVLGKKADAARSLERARKALAQNATALSGLNAMAAELDLN